MMNARLEASGSANFLAGGGEMGALLRERNWSDSALGHPETWPQSLKTAVRIMLTSRQPIWIGWGPQLTFFYNDAYQAIIGGKHPWALARPTSEVWREIWAEIGPLLATAMGGSAGTYVEEQLLIMERNGYPEETYYTFSYSPIPDDDGGAGGIICANADDTKRVIGDRQLTLLQDLAVATTGTRSWKDVCAAAAAALGTNSLDLPFALLYLTDLDGHSLALVGSSGMPAGHPAAPSTLAVDAMAPWPVDAAFRSQDTYVVSGLASRFGPIPFPTGAWHDAVSQVALLPISPGGETGRRGCLIVGLNPFRLFDGPYRDFLKLLTGQIAAAVANADAYEQERHRAESLAEISRAKTTFFSNVSHEFRTPLTLMLGPLEESLADAAALIPRERERITVVHRNALRLLKLVNSLLDFSRIEAGGALPSFEPLDLAALTADLAGNFRTIIEKAGLEFIIACPRLPEPVYVDRNMWEKIVLNLLSNAFKFTFEGAITVAVERRGARARLTVADTGTGIEAAQLPRLFERFHRIEGARGRSFEGSGIGLALVKELVDAQGGAIAAVSTPGKGTTFSIELPFGLAHVPPEQLRDDAAFATTVVNSQAFVEEALGWLPSAEAPASDAAAVSEAVPAVRTEARSRILLADDNADMRNYIARLLSARHDCLAVADGQAALEAARRERPDLVLTDIMMPRLDGFGLIKALREDAQLRDLPIIVISARAGEESSVEGLTAGADDYLAKPFSAREMLARVDGALAMARMRREMGDALRGEARSLEILVAARTAELKIANDELRAEALEREKIELVLRQSQKMDAVGKLTGGIAHDFNNLLQVIGGNLQLLANDVAGSAKGEQRLRNALAGVSRGSKLASQLLAFGRRQPLAPRVVNLGRFIRGLDDLLRRALGDGVEIETIIVADLWNTLVDTSQVENAVLNLAINARDAMNEHGKLTLEAGNVSLDADYAATHADVRAADYVMLAVTDTGCGMTPDVMEHVFEPFFTTKEEGRGTGLGLSMVYGFVKQSGGHINIYSEPGEGTTIRIYLPRVSGAEDVVAEIDTGPVTGGTETVLVVEDDDEVRETVVELFADLGYRVLKSRNAHSALAIVDSGVPIDLLFTDVVMPGPVRSPELARQARMQLPHIAVLFTSGYTENAIVHGGRLDPGVELLSKPYTRAALARKVRHVLRNQQQKKIAASASAAQANTKNAGRARRLTILFVEDDELIQMSTLDMLTGLGHVVFTAVNAQDALQILRRREVDVLVTDLGLPGMSGGRLAAEATRLKPGLPVIFATGAEGASGAERDASTPGAVTLHKPYDPISLDAALKVACERRRAGRAVRVRE